MKLGDQVRGVAAAVRVAASLTLERRYLAGVAVVAMLASGTLCQEPAASEPPFMVLIVGYSGSGKSTLVHEHKQLSTFVRIETEAIHRMLREQFPRLNYDVVGSFEYWELQWLTKIVRQQIMMTALNARQSFVIDACNLSRKDRKSKIAAARRHGYATMVIHVTTPEETLLERLAARDAEYVRAGRCRAYVDLYHKVQAGTLQPPTAAEADRIFVFRSGRDDVERLLIAANETIDRSDD